MTLIIQLLIFFFFLSAITFLIFKIKNSQDKDIAENYMSTDAESCVEVHRKFWESYRNVDYDLDVIPSPKLNYYCTVCNQYR